MFCVLFVSLCCFVLAMTLSVYFGRLRLSVPLVSFVILTISPINTYMHKDLCHLTFMVNLVIIIYSMCVKSGHTLLLVMGFSSVASVVNERKSCFS